MFVCRRCFYRTSEDGGTCPRCDAAQKEPAVSVGVNALMRMMRRAPRSDKPKADADRSDAIPGANSDMVYCRACGGILHKTAFCCPHCGAQQPHASPISGETTTESLGVRGKRRFAFTVLALGALWFLWDTGALDPYIAPVPSS
jgi:hypothetical protein